MTTSMKGGFQRDDTTGALLVAGYGVELAYASSTSGMTVTTAAQDVAGVQIGFNATSRPFKVRARAWCQIGIGTGAAGGDSQLELTLVDETAAIVATNFWKTKVPAAGNVQQSVEVEARIGALTPGTAKTYKLQVKATALPVNTTQSIVANAGNADGVAPPVFIEAVER